MKSKLTKKQQDCDHRLSTGESATTPIRGFSFYDKCVKCNKYFDWCTEKYELNEDYDKFELTWGRDYQGRLI